MEISGRTTTSSLADCLVQRVGGTAEFRYIENPDDESFQIRRVVDQKTLKDTVECYMCGLGFSCRNPNRNGGGSYTNGERLASVTITNGDSLLLVSVHYTSRVS